MLADRVNEVLDEDVNLGLGDIRHHHDMCNVLLARKLPTLYEGLVNGSFEHNRCREVIEARSYPHGAAERLAEVMTRLSTHCAFASAPHAPNRAAPLVSPMALGMDRSGRRGLLVQARDAVDATPESGPGRRKARERR